MKFIGIPVKEDTKRTTRRHAVPEGMVVDYVEQQVLRPSPTPQWNGNPNSKRGPKH